MNILYCGDANMENGILLSTLSLISCTEEELCVYILTAGMTQEKRFPISKDFENKLTKTLKRKNENSYASVIDISEIFFKNIPQANIKTRFTPFCMLRLFADEVKEIPDRILYLDTDVLCRKDFVDFYNKKMADCDICGALDRYGKYFFKKSPFKFNYINSGVLLINMKRVRENKTFLKCRELCKNKKMFMPDQSALNKICEKNIISRIYNEQGDPNDKTVFQHFSTRFLFFPYIRTRTVKPWETERVKNVLKINDYNKLFESYKKEKENYEK